MSNSNNADQVSPKKPGGARNQPDDSLQDRMISGGRVDPQIKINLPKGPYDLKQLLDEVLKARGVNDRFTTTIIGALTEIREIHLKLAEWKNLHNYLNEILVKSGDVKLELLRTRTEGLKIPDYHTWRSELKVKWSSTRTMTEDLLEWLQKVRYIEEKPFHIHENLEMEGPKWIINLQISHNDIMKFLNGEEIITPMEAIGNFLIFISQVEDRMYQADKSLRETAGDLNNKSDLVLGSLSDD